MQERSSAMRGSLLTAALLAGLVTTSVAAYAQDATIVEGGVHYGNGVTTGSAGSRSVVVDRATGEIVGTISNEQRPRFREYVVQERVPSYSIPERVVVGATLPEAGVTYYDVPERYAATPYRYTVVNDRTVLVDPRSRRIMQVVD
jgi:hypothetical protein